MATSPKEALAVVKELSDRLDLRNQESQAYDRYYTGLHPMPWIHQRARSEYRKLMKQAVSNFPLLIVDSVADRLEIEGFRLSDTAADDTVWTNIWQRNKLDVYAPAIHTQALVTSISYASVWPTEDGMNVTIRPESCYECIHDSEPGDPLKVIRALKKWANPVRKRWYAHLHLDTGEVFKLEGPWMMGQHSPDKWETIELVENPFGDEIGIRPFLNRPQLDGTGRSELADVIPVFDRINTLTADMLLAAELAAFKIRWATGIDVPRDEAGNPVEPFDVAMDRLWVSENPEAKFGNFESSSLEPYGTAIDQAIQQAAAITRTPPFLLLGKLTNLSAEALKATESGLVKKVQNRARSFGESWEDLMRLGLKIVDPSKADIVDMETIWVDPENISEAARVDALTKLYNIGLPKEAVWEKWGASPQEIERFKQMAMTESLDRALANAVPAGPGLSTGPATINNGQQTSANTPDQMNVQVDQNL